MVKINYPILIVMMSLLTLSLDSCKAEEPLDNSDSNTLNNIFDELSENLKLSLRYNVMSEDSLETLNIQIDQRIEMMTDQTNVLQRAFEAIYNEGLYYDMYILLTHEGNIALGITSPDLSYIMDKEPQAIKFIEDLSLSNKSAMISSLAANAFTHSDIDTMIVKCAPELEETPAIYQGYELSQDRGVTSCNFIFKVGPEIYRLSYNLTEKDSGMSNIQYPSYKEI